MPSCSVCGFSWCSCKGPGKVLDGKTYCVKCYEAEIAKRGMTVKDDQVNITGVSISNVRVSGNVNSDADSEKDSGNVGT